MSDPINDTASVSWRGRTIRRAAGTLGAAVVLATVGPAIANAAGADVANPIAVALRASGKTLVSAFDADDDAPCVTTETPGTDVEVTAAPTGEPVESESANPDDTVSATPTEVPTDTPTEVPTDAPTELPSGEPAEDCDEEEAEPSESPSEEPSESPSEEPAEETAEEGNHGQIVSTVAKCAPRGKDPLLDLDGAPSNHGGYVKVAAHGDTLTLPWGTYDLSTQAGADDLCASLEAARADLADEAAAEKGKKGKKAKKDKAKHGRPDKAKGGKGKKH